MNEVLREFFDSRGIPVQVDRDAAVIRGVKILGLESRNGRTYLPAALAKAASLYENAKVNVNHPRGNPDEPRDYRDRIGAIRNVTLRHGEGLFADFHFNPKHTLAEQLVWDAEQSPENVGFSHNVQAKTARRGERVVVEAITRVQSVDLVADPATTHGLYEMADDTARQATRSTSRSVINITAGQRALASLTLDQLQESRPDLCKAIASDRDAELKLLREDNRRLMAGESLRRKEQLARRLLCEHELPSPETTDPREKVIVDDAFFESLLDTEDEAAMREAVRRRAALVQHLTEAAATKSFVGWKPRSRDQYPKHQRSEYDTTDFIAAITR